MVHAAEIIAAARPPSMAWGAPIVLRAGTDGIAESSVAAGPDGRALTYWQGLVGNETSAWASTYGTDLPLTGPPAAGPPSVGPRPATKDTVAPRVAVRTKRLRLGRTLTLRLACDEPCTVKARPSLVARQRTTRLRAVTKGRAARSQTLTFRVPSAQLVRLRRVLAVGRRVRLRVELLVTDAARNARASTATLVVRR